MSCIVFLYSIKEKIQSQTIRKSSASYQFIVKEIFATGNISLYIFKERAEYYTNKLFSQV